MRQTGRFKEGIMRRGKLTVLRNHISLQKKVIWIYIMMAIIPIVLITAISNVIYTRSFLRQSYSLVERNAQQHEIVVQERMHQYENVLYELITDKNYIELAHDINTGDASNWLIKRETMETKLQSVVYTYDGIRGISFLADNDFYASYSRYYGSSGDIIWSDKEEREKIRETINEKQGLTFLAMVNLNNRESANDYVVMLGYPVKNLRTKEQSGVLVIALDADVLLFKGLTAEENGITTVIVDQQENILAGAEEQYINQPLSGYLAQVHGHAQVSVRRHAIEGTDWTIVYVIDIARQREDIYHFDMVVFFLMLGISIFFFWLVYWVSKGYLDDINRIVSGITGFGENAPEIVNVELGQRDELYVIAEQFNVMTRRVNTLMETLRQRNEEIKIAAENQKHAEIAALEAQINPHFLYNTLDSINWRAISHGEEEISDMLGALGSLMRYSVSNIDRMVVLAAEIEWLKKYVFLQRDRFNNSFDCGYDITEEASEFPIYKMLLQPIIENTILHAFEDVRENGWIEVRAYVKDEGEELRIHIKDNGCGMPEEKVREIRENIIGSGVLSSESIGISNVIHRLRIYYQDEASISVESRLGEGTEFILTIPRRTDKG